MKTNDDKTESLLSPKSTPTGVKRVNNWPLIIMFCGLGVFLFVIMLVGIDRAQQQEEQKNAPVTEQRHARDSSALAKEITSGFESGYVAPAHGEIPPENEKPKSEATLANSEAANSPELAKPSAEVQQIAEQSKRLQGGANDASFNRNKQRQEEIARRISDARLKRLEEAALGSSSVQFDSKKASASSGFNRSNTSFAFNDGSSNRHNQLAKLAQVKKQLASTNAMLHGNDPMAAYKAKLDSIKGSLGALTGSPGALTAPSTPTSIKAKSSTGDAYSSFDGTASRWNLSSSMQAPSSDFELRAGSVIPGVMISGINSDLPGQIHAQVSQNIYDTPTGNSLLVPQGTKLIGSYSSNVSYGQERVMIAWQRLVFPDGKALDIGSMAGADGAGYAGFEDKVNHHFLRIFGSALMMSVITAGVELSQDSSISIGEKKDASSALSEAMGQQLGQAAAKMIMKNLNIAPTIEIRPGYRFNIMVSKDVVFDRPYKNFDYK